jgi:carboxyl-terminal processing protease
LEKLPFILSDGSLLESPCVDVMVDGQRIEGVGVTPTVPVDYILEYSQGGDPALTAAINKAVEIME